MLYVSSFSGSAGTIIITEDEALFWTDARYHIQAEMELDENWTLMKSGSFDDNRRTQEIIKIFILKR